MEWRERIRIYAASGRALGIGDAWRLARHRLLGHRSPFMQRSAGLFHGAGIEVGGPSPLFSPRGYAPVYALAGSLDNVNFSARTHWEGTIPAGASFRFRDGAAPGQQFFSEATCLRDVADARYDFLLSCHMLEHSANPLKALAEWRRVLAPGGTLILALPHKDGTFDRHRPVTPLPHLVDDFERDMGEDDASHFEEVLRLHDMKRDPGQPSRQALRTWVEGNAVNRGVHHHVFDSLAAAALVDHAGFQLLAVEPAAPESIFLFARKSDQAGTPDNAPFLSATAAYLAASPFPSDRARAAAPKLSASAPSAARR